MLNFKMKLDIKESIERAETAKKVCFLITQFHKLQFEVINVKSHENKCILKIKKKQLDK